MGDSEGLTSNTQGHYGVLGMYSDGSRPINPQFYNKSLRRAKKMRNTTWNRRWSATEETEVATRVENGITIVRYPDAGDIFTSYELDDMWCDDMFLNDVTIDA